MDSSIYQSLQEAYLEDVYSEEYRKLPFDKMIKKSDQYDKQYKFGPGKTDAEYNSREAARGKAASTFLTTRSHDPKTSQQKSAANKNRPDGEKRSKTVTPGSKPNNFGNRLMRKDGQGIKDSYDYSDLVLDYLLDEGYVDDVNSGMVFINHMSEEWVESILERYKELPARKMVDKIVDRASDRGAGGSLSSGYLDDKRTNKMIGVLGNHNAEKAKKKSISNKMKGAGARAGERSRD